ncbi:MAG: tyrosine-type recombinase/integrase, partial [Rhodomicrobium sp.]
EQGKGRKDRFAMLSPMLLDILREWYRIGRPQGWLFPGRDPVNPLTTRQLNRVCHMAARLAGINKRVSAHTLRTPGRVKPSRAMRLNATCKDFLTSAARRPVGAPSGRCSALAGHTNHIPARPKPP